MVRLAATAKTFREIAAREIRWKPVDGVGLEHLSVRSDGGGTVACGVVVGQRGGKPYGVRYSIVCDGSWHVLELHLDTTDGRAVNLSSDGSGNWADSTGRSIAQFSQCIDVDLAGTPFTNTLPIRRLNLNEESGAVELKMLYVPFDTFEPIVDFQRYRCLQRGHVYRYEAVDRSFSADLPVDDDGIVLDYPTLFDRVSLE